MLRLNLEGMWNFSVKLAICCAVFGYFPLQLNALVTAQNVDLLRAGLERAHIALADHANMLIFRQ